MKAYIIRQADEQQDIMAVFVDRRAARHSWVYDYAGYMVNWEDWEPVKEMLRAFHQAEQPNARYRADGYGEYSGVQIDIMEVDE